MNNASAEGRPQAIAKRENAEIQRAISTAQESILTQRTPPDVVKQRPGKGGRTFYYVEHAWVTEQLNLAFGWAWDWEIVEWRLLPSDGDPQEAMVVGRLTVTKENGGTIVKQQFGQSDIKRNTKGAILSIADDLKAASSDCLKKCASLLGLALDLYSEDVTRYEEPTEQLPTRDDLFAEAARLGFSKASTLRILQREELTPFDPSRYVEMLQALAEEADRLRTEAQAADMELA